MRTDEPRPHGRGTAIDGLPPLRDVIERFQLNARRRLGQNFILDLNLTARIAGAAGPLSGFTVVEVGPGPGGLTRALLSAGADKVVAIERDERCLGALEEIADHYPHRLQIVAADALSVDMASLVSGPAKIVANLPYNVATPLLIGWLRSDPWPPWYTSATVMVQREVADRMTAAAGSRVYGRLSVICQWRSDCRKQFDVDRRAFTPVPKVTSTVVTLTPRVADGPHCTVESLEKVTAAAFGQRRKMLRSSLKSLIPDAAEHLESLGIDPAKRAEDLGIEEFCEIAGRL